MRGMLICLGCLVLCAVAIILKTKWESPSQPATGPALLTADPEPAREKRRVFSTRQLAPASDSTQVLLQIKAALQSDDSADHNRALNELLPDLVRRDPKAAADFALSPDSGNWRSEVLRIVAQAWATSKPQPAVEWASRLPNPDDRAMMISLVCQQVGEIDPAWAIKALERSGSPHPGSIPSATLENLAQQWAERDLKSSLVWAARYPSGEERDKLFARIAFAQSKSSPSEAAQIVVDRMSPGSAQDDAALAVLHQWAWQDMAGASAWVAQFPPGELRDRTLKELEGIKAHQAAP